MTLQFSQYIRIDQARKKESTEGGHTRKDYDLALHDFLSLTDTWSKAINYAYM